MELDSDEESDEEDVDPTNMRWQITERHYFNQTNAKLVCATFHPKSGMLIAGFSTGIFGLYELPDLNMIHTLRYAARSPLLETSNVLQYFSECN